MERLWGVALAKQLVAGLDRALGAQAVPLTALEPALDPHIHHTNMPIAIAISRASQAHILAVVEGGTLRIDGVAPTDLYGLDDTEATRAAGLAALAKVATDWLDNRIDELGVIDAGLAMMTLLRPHGTWLVYFSSGGEARICACEGRVRRPPAINFEPAKPGVRLRCGDSDRIVRTRADLADFPTREVPLLVAQIARCTTFSGELVRAKAVGNAALALAQRKIIDRTWTAHATAETLADTRPAMHLAMQDATGYTATFEAVPGGVTMTCEPYTRTFLDARDLETHVDEVIAAITASIARVTRSNLVPGMLYRVRKPFVDARKGDVLTFRGIVEYKPRGEGWRFESDVKRGVTLGDDSPELAVLADYLEPF
ncbi:MAG: hypothetical protein ABI867_45555 [Kofleriaceae bacterium]